MEVEPDIENMTLEEYLNYPHYYKDIEIKKYYKLPPLHPYFQPPQPYTEAGLVSPNESDEVDIDSMTIAEYELYVAKQSTRKNRLSDHTYGFTFNSCDQSPCTPNPQPKDKELSLEEDVRIEDVERLRQILTPPDDAYNAPAMNPILDELFDEFGNKLLDITVVDEEAYSNPTRDIEELKRLPAKDPRSYFTEIKVHSVIVKTNEESEPFIHTQTLSPLYGVFKSFKSSTKPYKVEREMTSPPW
ncbi:hypothetical protein Tco_1434224 [Tanacetum coccineum]